MLYSNLSVNQKGHLEIAGVDTVHLAAKYGTPLYVLDENRMRDNCRVYVSAMKKYFGKASMPLYASKALSFKEIYRIASEENMGIDVVSAGELYTALKAGYPAEKAFFHGNSKNYEEISFAIDNSIGYIVVDNRTELDMVNECAKSRNIVQKILLRLAPGIDSHTHQKISTGRVDSKFGTAIATGQAEELFRHAISLDSIDLCGFHCHIGSQIFECEPFFEAADVMLEFINNVKLKYAFATRIFDIGSGFGCRYTQDDPITDIDSEISALADHIKTKCSELSLEMPAILMEPGRGIVADTCLTLYTVNNVKEITGYKNYVAIDGGMCDNPRYTLYQAKHTPIVANKADKPLDFVCTIAGRCCESGDVIREDTAIQTPAAGDILAVLTTGAYNYSMASNYNRICRPPVVIVKEGTDRLGVRRETFEDLTACDM